MSKNPYWGLTSDEITKAIKNARSSAETSTATREWPPKLVMPSSNANKFGNLTGYAKFGDPAPKSSFGFGTPLSGNKQALLKKL
jgi:hypothetical protein